MATVAGVRSRTDEERMRFYPVDKQQGFSAMQRIKHPPMRNKIDLSDPRQVRGWTRRLRIPPDELKMVVGKIGNSAAAVTKEVELRRITQKPAPDLAIPSAAPVEAAGGSQGVPPASGVVPASPRN
jgi:hypothetical protein